ncbi:hypothetical protein CALVIDRAFT_542719 [Calocera viscosa TUFC12733]|uniref:Uncharacterized protein n=1 Tax=Calocera viscosa (strain TUFC12733) TaxID=1330018 RepID=A0A167GBY4_CALVF|nr:hypothetical protein CALVIDRAFT_542719 [Calocera viscosa TUFC12733]
MSLLPSQVFNSGGSMKAAVVLKMIEDAKEQGLLRLHPNSVFMTLKGTVETTGISLETVPRARLRNRHTDAGQRQN